MEHSNSAVSLLKAVSLLSLAAITVSTASSPGLLCDLVDPLREKPGHIGVFRRISAPFLYDRLELIRERRSSTIAFAETSIGTGVTNRTMGLALIRTLSLSQSETIETISR